MKKIVTLTLLSLFVINSFAQITIADNDENDLTNQTAFLPVSPDKVYFNITNNGASEITFIVEVTSVTIPGDALGISVCACGQCVPITTTPVTIGDPTNLGAGLTYGTNQADVEYFSDGSTGAANITVKVYEQGNETNFAEFTLDTEYVGVYNINRNDLISIYPNPATSYFNIKVSDEYTDSKIAVTNIIGKVVKTIELKSENNHFSTNELVKGIYFVSLINDKEVLATKKLILN